jgi:hypothetical protein
MSNGRTNKERGIKKEKKERFLEERNRRKQVFALSLLLLENITRGKELSVQPLK